MGFIKVYTKEATGELYPNSLANSVHLAISEDGEKYEALNQDYGILFAKAAIREDNTLAERGVKEPQIAKVGEEYYITAKVVDASGIDVPSGNSCAWKTVDFVHFIEMDTDESTRVELLCNKKCNKKCESIAGEMNVSANVSRSVEIPDELVPAIRERWIPLQAVSVEPLEDLSVSDIEELKNIRAKVIYSDGSVDAKPVFWDMELMKQEEDGRYYIEGKMEAVTTGFPLTIGLADPVIFHWEGKWYYIATNDNLNDIGLYVRRADSVKGLFAEGVETSCILDYDEARCLCQTFWAPEFHVIGDELYILFTVSGSAWGPQCHMMRLKKGGDIMKAADWDDPIRVRKPDGNFLTTDGITLDMTYFKAGGRSYLAWSYRYGIGTPLDSGSMLYISTIDEAKPWQLTAEPVLLSRPLFGWENNSGTINNEGPYALILGDKVYLAYSGGAANGESYVIGYLVADTNADLLEVCNWEKEPTAVMHLQSVEGILGPGHNSFFRDEYGRLMIAYHAQEREKYMSRCSAYHRVHISKSGFPLLNVAGERDLPRHLVKVGLHFTLTKE